ncbi:MAG: hypothetical protein FJZ00_13935 [Candidatus Sericytochromatia bacterium]|uniref:Uncharacterized protein n=1 Tax=Candidatus Tanganyikabacteria bacterium TaxID=2961651 RepID=A0A937X5G4_9BACT|nr:hypothetical protein [Candidatus Tanganyikabacteria bacterium]
MFGDSNFGGASGAPKQSTADIWGKDFTAVTNLSRTSKNFSVADEEDKGNNPVSFGVTDLNQAASNINAAAALAKLGIGKRFDAFS